MISGVQPQLVFREWGNGYPVLILHGLFGSSDNWTTVAKLLAERYRVIVVDLRNHGASFHAPFHRYPQMAADVAALMAHLGILSASVMGHSMGGKVAMQFAADFPELIDRLVVVDILPCVYPPHHDDVFAGLRAVSLPKIRRRADADLVMAGHIRDSALRNFLLKSLQIDSDGNACWKFNLEALIAEYGHILGAPTFKRPIQTPTLFVMGGDSEYRTDDGDRDRRVWFPTSHVEIVPHAGHWLHAQFPDHLVRVAFSHIGE